MEESDSLTFEIFEIEDFKHSVRLWTTTLEISVLMAQFHSLKHNSEPTRLLSSW